MKVNIKKLHPNAVIPKYGRDGDAGLDLVAITLDDVVPGFADDDFTQYGTGLAVEIPQGYVGLIFPRSSISTYGLMLANSVGVIDSNYRGELKIRFKTTSDWGKVYQVGDKIAQLVIIPYPSIEFNEVVELSDTNRGDKGFGSSGS
jgi:dUTP pyrophosphatase